MDTRNIGLKSPLKRLSTFAYYLLPFAFFISGCAAFNAGGDMQRGRYALMRGDSKLAAGHFQRASEIDPNLYYRIGPMKEGIWTYLGRAHYDSGDVKLAQTALEQARKRHPDDNFAPMYLGLALSKSGDRQRAVQELQTGLKGLDDWMDWITTMSIDRAYWDPGSFIRDGIDEQLALIESKEINWPQLIAGSERIGQQLEEEVDKVNRDKRREQRDSAKGDDKSN
jgi:tetratricopeptide (TPR) repeat protein